MTQQVVAAILALAIAIAPGHAVLADETAAVSIDDIDTESCGEQSMIFGGSAQFDQMLDHLEVLLDEEQIHHEHGLSSESEESWTAESIMVDVGSHTLTAIVWDQDDGPDDHRGELARASADFTVAACASDEGASDDNGDQGLGGDCCPGQDDEDAVQQVTSAKVKGAKTTNLWASLKPLNSIFRSVFGRTPTFEEWKYWADRLLTDKPQYDALYGAMQWHKLLGHTTGN